jgi:protein TonB
MARESDAEPRSAEPRRPEHRRLECRHLVALPTSQAIDHYAEVALAEATDRRRLARAALFAVAAHAVLLVVQLPAARQVDVAATPRPVVHLLEPVRFEPPEVEPQLQLPRRRAQRVPVPDPTPDAPEPLPTLDGEPIVPDALGDVVFDIPQHAPEPTLPHSRYEQVLPVGGEVTRPIKVYAPAPRYPELARRIRLQGLVIVQAVIDREGNVVSAEVVKGEPMGLSEAALEAVRQWRFQPATLHGRPVAVQFSLTVRFELQ